MQAAADRDDGKGPPAHGSHHEKQCRWFIIRGRNNISLEKFEEFNDDLEL